MATNMSEVGISDYKYGFHDDVAPVFKSRKGLNKEIIHQISDMKDEPDWMLEFRLEAYEIFKAKPGRRRFLVRALGKQLYLRHMVGSERLQRRWRGRGRSPYPQGRGLD